MGPDRGDDWLLLLLLSQMLGKAFYAELRTRQQLGYIVQSSVSEMEGVRGLVFAVQSQVLPPPQLEQRLDAFLLQFREQLAAMPEAELATYREALAEQVSDVDKRLQQQAVRFWAEINLRRYDYERPWRVAAQVRALTKAQLLDFFDARIAAGGAQRRRLATHVFAQGAAPRDRVRDALADEGQEVEYWPSDVRMQPVVEV